MTNWMRDYERQQFEGAMLNEAKRQNDLLSVQVSQARQAQKEQKKQRFEDRIHQLRLALAQASDDGQRWQIQTLLSEAQEDYQCYLDAEEKARRKAVFWGILGFSVLVPVMIWGMIDMAGSHQKGKNNKEVMSQSQIKQSSEKKTSASSTVSSRQATQTSSSFTVTVEVDNLHIRQAPSLQAASLGVISPGTYTIVETQQVGDYSWGKLKSGQGWIALDMIGGDPSWMKQVPRQIDLQGGLTLRAFPTMQAREVGVTQEGETDILVEIVNREGYQWGYLKNKDAYLRLDNGDVKRVIGAAPAPLKQSVRVPDKDTKNLTTAEVANWAKALTHIKRATSSGTVALEGMAVDVWMADDGLVYADLSATGFPFVDEYRVNQEGDLELKTTDGKGDWQVVSEVYTYIQP